MQLVAYLVAYPLLWCIAILPFKALYFLSDVIYFLLYRIVRYRVKTVRQNLALTLPHLSESERNTIEKMFYHHVCDMFLEMIKTAVISEKKIMKRYQFTNIELVKEYEQKGKSIALMAPHYANWEWLVVLGKYIDYKGFGIYKTLSNKYFDQLMQKIRARFDAGLISAREASLVIRSNQNKGIHGTYLFLSDQTPYYRKGLHWESFLGIEVPVHMGAEALARKLDLNILYVNVEKVKRGYYKATFIPITDTIKNEPKFAPTRKFLDLVEQQVLKAPEYYFWTHKRWKHMDKEHLM